MVRPAEDAARQRRQAEGAGGATRPDWAPTLGAACRLLVRPVLCRGLRAVGALGRANNVAVRAQLQPWNVAQESGCVKGGGADPEWPAGEAVELHFPGLRGERALALLRVDVVHKGMLGSSSAIDSVEIPLDSIFLGLARENPLCGVFRLAGQGSIKLVVSAVRTEDELPRHVGAASAGGSSATATATATATAAAAAAVAAHAAARGGSGLRVVDMGLLMSKLAQMLAYAKTHLLGPSRSLASALAVHDAARDGTVSKGDFCRGLRALDFRLSVQELAVLMTMLEAEPTGRRAHAHAHTHSHAPQDAKDTEPAEKRVHYRELERLIEDYVREHADAPLSGGLSSPSSPASASSPLSPLSPAQLDASSRERLRGVLQRAQARGVSLQHAFRHFDKLGNGRITKASFTAGLHELGLGLSVKDTVMLVDELDRDGDGMVSLREFEAFFGVSGSPLAVPNAIASVRPPAVTTGEPLFAAQRSPTAIGSPELRSPAAAAAVAAASAAAAGQGGGGREGGGASSLQLRAEAAEAALARSRERERALEARLAESKLSRSGGASASALAAAALAKSKERLLELEQRLAQSHASREDAVARAAREATLAERRALEDRFVALVSKRLADEFGGGAARDPYQRGLGREGKTGEPESDEAAVRDLAFAALTESLEQQIAALNSEVRRLRAAVAQEKRRGDREAHRARRLEALVLERHDLLVPRLDSLGLRSTFVVRALIARLNLSGADSFAELFERRALERKAERAAQRREAARKRAQAAAAGRVGPGWSGARGAQRVEEELQAAESAADAKLAEEEELARREGRKLMLDLADLRSLLGGGALSLAECEELEREMVRGGLAPRFCVRDTGRSGQGQGAPAANNEVLLNAEALADGLERCKEWDLLQLMGGAGAGGHRPQSLIEDSQMPSKVLELALIAARTAALEIQDGQAAGPLDWFARAVAGGLGRVGRRLAAPPPSGQQDTGHLVTLDELNLDLANSALPCFDSQRELELCLEWASSRCPPSIAGSLLELWRRHGRVDPEALAAAVHHVCDSLAEDKAHQERVLALWYPEQQRLREAEQQQQQQQQLQHQRDQEQRQQQPQQQRGSKESKLEEKLQLALASKSLPADRSRYFSRFSESETSMQWAPLKHFGRPPYDCVRVVQNGLVAEHATDRTRSVMVFVEGEIEPSETERVARSGGRSAVALRLDAAVNGAWALCVTSAPPANRPVHGAAVYMSTGEARLEGAADVFGKSRLYTDVLVPGGGGGGGSSSGEDTPRPLSALESAQAVVAAATDVMVPSATLERFRGECKSDEHALDRVYARLLRDHKAFWELQEQVTSVVEDRIAARGGPRPAPRDVLLWKARELEAQLRMDHAKALEQAVRLDHWAADAAFRAAAQDSRYLRRALATATAASLFKDWRDLVDPVQWREQVLAPLQAAPADGEERASFDVFLQLTRLVEGRIRDMLGVSEARVERFRSAMMRKIARSRKGHQLHFGPLGSGDSLAAAVDLRRGVVAFFVNGALQTELSPTCAKPWRFAFYTNRNAKATLVPDPTAKLAL